MAKKIITEEQLRAANKAGYSTQQIAGELNKYEKLTGNDAVYSGNLPNGQAANPGLVPTPAQTGTTKQAQIGYTIGGDSNTITKEGIRPKKYAGEIRTGWNPKVPTQPVQTQANANTIDTSTGKPVSESPENSQYNILPESVTGKKPNVFVSPALQAKIDAKNAPIANPTPEVVPETTPAGTPTPTPEPVKTETVNTVKTETTPTGEVVISDVEKQAQATGIPYTMENGQPVYNATNKDEAVKVLQMGGKLAGETKMNAVAQATLNKVRGFAQMTDQQLANNIAFGKVSSKDLELLNQINPNLVAKAQEFSKKKVITNTTNEVQAVNDSIINGGEYDGVSTPLKELLTKLATIDADQRNPAEMKAQYEADHPEMVTARDTINTLQTQKREVERAKRDLWDDYKASHSSMPISMILAGYNIASKSLDDQMYSINDNLNTEISNYNSYLDEMKTEMDWEIAQQGKQEERLWNIYGVTSAEQIRQEDIQREDARIEQSIALEEARYQRDIEREDFKSAEARKQKIEDMKTEMNMNIETGLLNMGVNPEGMTPEELRATYARAAKEKVNYERSKDRAALALDYAKISPSTGSTGIDVARPTGQYTTVNVGNKNIQVDSAGASGISNAIMQMQNAGIPVTVAQGLRDQAETIRAMGERVGMPGATAAQLRAAGHQIADVGSSKHESGMAVDIYGKDGKTAPTQEQIDILAANGWERPDWATKVGDYGHFEYTGVGQSGTENFSSGDIALFNGAKYNPQTDKDASRVQRYYDYQNAKASLEASENPNILELMRTSEGGKPLSESGNKAYKDMNLVVGQLGNLKSSIDKFNEDKWFGDYLSPITGLISNNNPWDTKAADVKARLQAIVPKVARGIFGEVGVLTDQDIANYIQTLPNIKQTADVQDVVQLALLGTLKGALDSAVLVDSGTYNVSGITPSYKQLTKKIYDLEQRITEKPKSGLTKDDEREALSIKK